MSTSCVAEPPAVAEEEFQFNWIMVRQDPTAVAYASIEEMRIAPIQLDGRRAAQFELAKRTRFPRRATPLSLD
jgi:hypothetical protein